MGCSKADPAPAPRVLDATPLATDAAAARPAVAVPVDAAPAPPPPPDDEPKVTGVQIGAISDDDGLTSVVIGDGLPALSADGKRFAFVPVSAGPVTVPYGEVVIATVAGERVVTRLPLQPPDSFGNSADPALVARANAALARTTWKPMRALRLVCREGEPLLDEDDGAPCPITTEDEAFVYDVQTAVLDGHLVWEVEPNRLTYWPRAGGKPFARTFPRWSPRYRGADGVHCANEVWADAIHVADDDKTILFSTALRVDHACDHTENVVHAVTLP